MNRRFKYVPSAVPPPLRTTLLGLGWCAADIYATRSDSRDAILEAAMKLADLDRDRAFYLPLHRSVFNDLACRLALKRLSPRCWPEDPTAWANWQATSANLWPILTAAVSVAYKYPLPGGVTPGRYVA